MNRRMLRSDRFVTLGNVLLLICEKCCETTEGAEPGTMVALCPTCSYLMLFMHSAYH